MYWKGYNAYNFIGFLNPSSLIRRHVKNFEKSPKTIAVVFFFGGGGMELLASSDNHAENH